MYRIRLKMISLHKQTTTASKKTAGQNWCDSPLIAIMSHQTAAGRGGCSYRISHSSPPIGTAILWFLDFGNFSEVQPPHLLLKLWLWTTEQISHLQPFAFSKLLFFGPRNKLQKYDHLPPPPPNNQGPRSLMETNLSEMNVSRFELQHFFTQHISLFS